MWRRRARPVRGASVGLGWFRAGAIAGLAGALAGTLLPVAYLVLEADAPGALGLSSAPFWQVEGTLLLAGALLLALSLLLYRRAFARLRSVDRRFALPSALGWVGIVGFLALGVAAVLLTGSAGSLATCVHGSPTKALGCLASGPSGALWGAYAGAIGLAGAWLGGLGVAIGLAREGARTGRETFRWAAALYGLLLLVLIGPLVAIARPFEGAEALLVAVPLLLVAAPSAVLAGSLP